MAATFKIIFAGPPGSGQTQAVRMLSEVEVVSTAGEGAVPLPAVDYGRVTLPSGDQCHLFATPELQSVERSCGVITEQSTGLILLQDGSISDPVAQLRVSISALGRVMARARMVVGVTRLGSGDLRIRPALADVLVELGLPPLVMSVDVHKVRDLTLLLKTLVHSMTWVPAE